MELETTLRPLVERELGEAVVAMAFFAPPGVDLGPWRTVGDVVADTIHRWVDAPLGLHSVVAVTAREVAVIDFSYGGRAAVHKVFGRWGRAEVRLEEYQPWVVRLTVGGKASVDLEAVDPGPAAREVIELLSRPPDTSA